MPKYKVQVYTRQDLVATVFIEAADEDEAAVLVEQLPASTFTWDLGDTEGYIEVDDIEEVAS